MTYLILGRALIYGALGTALGAAYFSALAWNVRLYTAGCAERNALLVHMLRIIGVAAIFALCARQGAVPLLASFAGFLAIRTVAVSRYGLAIGGPP